MATRRLPPDFSNSAAYPLYAIDLSQDRAWVLHFNRDDYHRASFLDQRALRHRDISGWAVSGEELAAAAHPGPAQTRLHWIFHIGHCGSSLVSRLLDLVPGALGLREPLPLLTLAHEKSEGSARAWLPLVRSLLARGFDDTRSVVVKPTSIVTTLAPELLRGTGYACFLWVDLSSWLATLFRDSDLVESTLTTEHLRLAGVPMMSNADTPAARLARVWLGEQLRWWQLSRSEPGRILDLDFAEVIDAPARMAGRIAEHFSLEVPADWQERVAASGVLTRYAKDAAQAFDASTRRKELDLAANRHSAAITEGLTWATSEIERLDMPQLAARLYAKD